MMQRDLFDQPPAPPIPGWKEPTTSREAAVRMAARAPILRDQVLDVLRKSWPRGQTADEVAAILGKTWTAIRPRLSELRNAGAIEPTVERRLNESGMSARVWIWVNR